MYNTVLHMLPLSLALCLPTKTMVDSQKPHADIWPDTMAVHYDIDYYASWGLVPSPGRIKLSLIILEVMLAAGLMWN